MRPLRPPLLLLLLPLPTTPLPMPLPLLPSLPLLRPTQAR